jgi:hypothetical protein
MTFKEYVGQDGAPPPTFKRRESITLADQLRIDKYISKGALGQEDIDDIHRMLSTGHRFEDALSRALQQANDRKYKSMRQPNAAP